MQAADPGGRRSEPQAPASTPPAGPSSPPGPPAPTAARPDVSLLTIAREWGRIGCIGFGGPPAHIALLRALCVDRRGWISAQEFEDGIAATNILPGPASTQLAIFCAWRLRGARGALVGGACFIVPGLIVILALSAVFLATHPPRWISGAAGGADAAVPIVAISAAVALLPASWRRVGAASVGSSSPGWPERSRGGWRTSISTRPQPTSTRNGPTSAAATPPATR